LNPYIISYCITTPFYNHLFVEEEEAAEADKVDAKEVVDEGFLTYYLD
jgi:hypothetical protein